MPRLIVILLISWAYVGCGARVAGPVDGRPLLTEGAVRVAVDREAVAAAVRVSAVTQPLVALLEPHRDPHCRRFRFDPPASDPTGAAVLPQDVVVELEQRLRDPDSAARWLLSPIDGAPEFAAGRRRRVDGLSVDGAFLSLCSAGPVPDLEGRLAHPGLQYWRGDPSGAAVGPGPFAEEDDSGALVANPHYSGARPRVRRIDRIPTDNAAHLLMELDEADVALLYGESADRLLAAPRPSLRLERAPDWDRRLVLWLNPQVRWLNDPRFRRWVAGAVDRPAMLDYLFAGRGEAVHHLLGDPERELPFDAVVRRPVAPLSEPRFALSFDARDRDAETIAARIKATLRGERVQVTLVPIPRAELSRRLLEGRVQAALLPDEPFFHEPLLRLRETCAGIGPSADAAAQVLDQAAPLSAPEDRLRAALAAQDILLQDALVIPLLSLHAWLATRSDLAGVRSGPRRVLQFHEAGWLR